MFPYRDCFAAERGTESLGIRLRISMPSDRQARAELDWTPRHNSILDWIKTEMPL